MTQKKLWHCAWLVYIHTYYTALGDEEKFDDKYLLNEIAPVIATDWKSVGIQLGIPNVDNYAQTIDLTDEKFRRMLKMWLVNNKAKTLDEIFDKFHEALLEIDLNADAEDFLKKAKKFKSNHGVPN